MNQSLSRLVAVVGPESTGKTTLAMELARIYHGAWLPEYAREFLADTQYTQEEVHIVAREQLNRERDFVRAKPQIGILDTDGVVLRVWFSERFGHVPSYIERHLELQAARTYLLTFPDLPCVFDSQRESKSELMRLFEIYERLLADLGFDYAVVRGHGEARTVCAVDALKLLDGN